MQSRGLLVVICLLVLPIAWLCSLIKRSKAELMDVEKRYAVELSNCTPPLTPTFTNLQASPNSSKLAYEVHGIGDTKFLMLHGLGGQVQYSMYYLLRYFGHEKGLDFTVLTLDYTNINQSRRLVLSRSMRQVAQDIVDVLKALQWSDDQRNLHIIGVSMGGMIGQQLGLLIPSSIASPTLIATTSNHLKQLRPSVEQRLLQLYDLATKTAIESIEKGLKSLYSKEFLDAVDDVGTLPNMNERLVLEVIVKRHKRDCAFLSLGMIPETIGAGTYSESWETLKQFGESITGKRILIIHGGQDNLIPSSHAEKLFSDLGGEEAGVQMKLYEHAGHGVVRQNIIEVREIIYNHLVKNEKQ